MKRIGHVIEKIAELSNLEASFNHVLAGKNSKTKTGAWLIEHKDEVLLKLQSELLSGMYKIQKYQEFTRKELHKVRLIQCVTFYDRIALHAISAVIESLIVPTFIADTAASLKGRGGLYLFNRMYSDMQKDPEGTKYVYKCDIKKCYQSIDQEMMMEVIKRFFKDPILIKILDGIVHMMPEGVSIGTRTSQVLVNLYLSVYFDHPIKEGLRFKYYRRYCDDMVLQAESYERLQEGIDLIHKQADLAKLCIKGNEQKWCITDRCIDFLGYRAYSDGRILLRKHIVSRFARHWNKVQSKDRKIKLIGSFYGIAKHADSKYIFHKITNITMKSFADFGIKYTFADGKKSFDCECVPMSELVNLKLEVLDYEKDVSTAHGDHRYLVFAKISGTDKHIKFFTNSDEVKQALDQINEMHEIPFSCTVVRKSFGGGRGKYVFA